MDGVYRESSELKVTSLSEVKAVACGALVELPPFAEGTHFVARLRRPSMLTLAKSGKIPNELLISANSLFEDGAAGAFDSMNKDMLTKCFDLFDIICEASFVEPTYRQLKEAGIELTDEQYMFVFGYAQNGVRQLESFRK